MGRNEKQPGSTESGRCTAHAIEHSPSMATWFLWPCFETGKVEGRRARGRQRLKFLDSLFTCWEDKMSPAFYPRCAVFFLQKSLTVNSRSRASIVIMTSLVSCSLTTRGSCSLWCLVWRHSVKILSGYFYGYTARNSSSTRVMTTKMIHVKYGNCLCYNSVWILDSWFSDFL